jgi:DNA-binding TFAR19-related protein (PDSD5 family)
MLDWVPARLHIVRVTRPKYAHRISNNLVQVAAPGTRDWAPRERADLAIDRLVSFMEKEGLSV